MSFLRDGFRKRQDAKCRSFYKRGKEGIEFKYKESSMFRQERKRHKENQKSLQVTLLSLSL